MPMHVVHYHTMGMGMGRTHSLSWSALCAVIADQRAFMRFDFALKDKDIQEVLSD